MARDFPWYEVAGHDTPLEQGDLLKECPAFVPDYTTNPILHPQQAGDETPVPGVWRTYDVVVLTQSCDIAQSKVDNSIVCPYFSPEDMLKIGLKKDAFEQIRRGNMPKYHMLERCKEPGHVRDIVVVDFGSAYTIPLAYVIKFAASQGPRLRLLPPYREHLSQAFAKFFMRVGLPTSINLPKL